MPDKPQFNALQAAHLTHVLSVGGNKQQAEELLRDWRAFLLGNFSLTDDQRQWLESVGNEREAEVRQLLRETINSNGALRLVVVMVADHSKSGGLYHELRQESVQEERQGLRPNLVIAHCDAHCRNWGWGAG